MYVRTSHDKEANIDEYIMMTEKIIHHKEAIIITIIRHHHLHHYHLTSLAHMENKLTYSKVIIIIITIRHHDSSLQGDIQKLPLPSSPPITQLCSEK